MHTAVSLVSHDPIRLAADVGYHGSLPAIAQIVGFLALIWLAATVIAVSGWIVGGLFCLTMYRVFRVCARIIRLRRGRQYAHLVTLDDTGTTTRVVSVDRYHGRCQHSDDPITDTDPSPRRGEGTV